MTHADDDDSGDDDDDGDSGGGSDDVVMSFGAIFNASIVGKRRCRCTHVNYDRLRTPPHCYTHNEWHFS